MLFKDQYSTSFPQKAVFSALVIAAVMVSLTILLNDILWTIMPIGINLSKTLLPAGNTMRKIVIAFCLVLYFVRLMFTVWVFQKRKWTWLETAIISILMPVVIYAFATVGGKAQQGLGYFDFIGLSLYLVGSYINTNAECTRHVWKKREENHGKIYTEGLFRYAVHINYFFDMLLFYGLAMISRSLYIIPTIMTVNFLVFIIPSLDRYLEGKYGDAFRDYAERTKKLIPLVY